MLYICTHTQIYTHVCTCTGTTNVLTYLLMENCLTGPKEHQLTLSRKEQFDTIATEIFSSKENKNCCKAKRNIDTQ